MEVGFILIFWIVPTFVAHAIGKGKGKSNSWLWGLLLGWIGVIVVALQRSELTPVGTGPAPGLEPSVAASRATKACPECAESVQPEARVCRYCGHRFDDTTAVV